MSVKLTIKTHLIHATWDEIALRVPRILSHIWDSAAATLARANVSIVYGARVNMNREIVINWEGLPSKREKPLPLGGG